MKASFLSIILFLFIPFILFAQDKDALEERPLEIGILYQMYPAGYVPSLYCEWGMGQYYKHGLSARLGYNITRRKSWGEHEDERGGGIGGSLGYRFYVTHPFKGFIIGSRFDVWNLNIDWTNSGVDEILFNDDDEIGTSKILILQPTIEIAYKFLFKNNFYITPSLAAGWEYNAITRGDDVGQGSIVLWGFDLGLRF